MTEQTEQAALSAPVKTNELSLNIKNFNGPLDLLLHLVKEAKIEIKDIFLSEVTSQFLAYMTQLNTLDVDKASEYMEIAATLLEIKSHSLLPVMPGLEDDSAETSEQLLIRRLEEYAKLFKEASMELKELENQVLTIEEEDGTLLRMDCGDPEGTPGTGSEVSLWFDASTHALSRGEISVDGFRAILCEFTDFAMS